MKLPKNAQIALILAVGGFACSMGLRALDPVVPNIAESYQVSIRAASLTASIFALAYGFGQLIMGPLADKLGRYKMLSIAMLLVTIFSLIALTPHSYLALLASRFGAGLFASAVVSSSLALLTQIYDANKRGIIIARFMMAVITAQLLGAVIMSKVAPHFYMMFLLLALFPFIGLILLYPFRHDATLNETSQGNLLNHIMQIFKQTNLPLLALLGFLEGILVFGPIPYVSVKLAGHSANSTSIAGYAIACFAIGGLIFAATSHLTIKLLKQNQFTVGIALLAVCWLILTYTTTDKVVLIAMLGVGFSFYTLHNLLQVNAGSCYPPARASAMSFFMFSFFIGQGIGPLLFGTIMAHQNLNESFQYFALMALLVAILSYFIRHKIVNNN